MRRAGKAHLRARARSAYTGLYDAAHGEGIPGCPGPPPVHAAAVGNRPVTNKGDQHNVHRVGNGGWTFPNMSDKTVALFDR